MLASAALIAIVSLLTFGVLLKGLQDQRDAAARGRGTTDALNGARELRLLTLTMQSGARGYLLTRSEASRTGFERSRDAIPPVAAKLARTESDTAQRREIVAIAALLRGYSNDLDSAIASGSLGRDTSRFAAIDAGLRHYTAAEAREQLAVRAESNHLRNRAIAVATGGLAVLLALIALVAYAADRAIVEPVKRLQRFARERHLAELDTVFDAAPIGLAFFDPALNVLRRRRAAGARAAPRRRRVGRVALVRGAPARRVRARARRVLGHVHPPDGVRRRRARAAARARVTERDRARPRPALRARARGRADAAGLAVAARAAGDRRARPRRLEAGAPGVDVGGDFYDAFPIGEGVWGLAIGDVCGKGVDAAALTALARHTLRAAAHERSSPSAVLALLNRAVLAAGRPGQFLTAIFARLAALGDGRFRLVFACGGHPPPVLLDAALGSRPLRCTVTLLGVVDDPELVDAEVELDAGDTLLLYTDGLTEAGAPARILATEDVAALLASVRGETASQTAEGCLREALAASGGAIRDDIAVLVARVGLGVISTAGRTAAAESSTPGQ